MEDGSLVRNVIDDDDIMGGENIVPYIHTGEIRFYDDKYTFIAWCVEGVVKSVIEIE